MNTTYPQLSRLAGKLSVVSATFQFTLYKMAGVETMQEEEKKTKKRKNFRWSDEMIEQLIDFLNAYKIEMEFKGLDFDADKCTQYKQLRISMAKLYSCTDPEHPNFLCFGPVSVTDVPENFDKLSLEEQEAIKADIKISKDLIAKAHKRVVEKVKEIRQNYSKAVVSGRRSGSGKMIYEHYDKLVQIWGSTPNVSPLKFGVSADNFKTIQVIQLDENDVNLETDCSPALNTSESGHDLGFPLHFELLPDIDDDETDGMEISKTPKRKENVGKFVDDKRKHLQRNLSAAQRDKMLLDEAKEDAQFRKDMTEALRESTKSFSKGVKEMSSAMLGVGAGMSQSIQMLTNALLQQQVQSYGPQQLFPPYQVPPYQNNPQGYFSQMSNNNPTFQNESTQSSANNSVESNVSGQSKE